MDNFNTSWVTRMVIAFMAMIIINIIGCTVIETVHYSDRRDSVVLFMRHAADYTRVNLQTISSTSYTGSSTAISKDKIKDWVVSVGSQARANGTMTPWLEDALQKIMGTAGRIDMFTPLNFGLTYLDKDDYQNMFEQALNDLVEFNYGSTTQPKGAGLDWGTVLIDDVRVTVSDPIVKNLAADNTLLKSIFGSPTVDTGDFLYVITYNVTIEVDWSSVTTTPAYKIQGFPGAYSGPVDHLKDQVIWKSNEPIVLQTTYVLTN